MVDFAKIADVDAGTKLRADGGFTCIPRGAVLTVQRNDHGELYVPCRSGQHSLDGQEEGDHYLGLSLVDEGGR